MDCGEIYCGNLRQDDRGCPQIKIPTRRQLTLVSSSVGESKCDKSRYCEEINADYSWPARWKRLLPT